jgi:hypothetical protein
MNRFDNEQKNFIRQTLNSWCRKITHSVFEYLEMEQKVKILKAMLLVESDALDDATFDVEED